MTGSLGAGFWRKRKATAEFRMVAFDELPLRLRALMAATNDLVQARRLACAGIASFEEAEAAVAEGIETLPGASGYVLPESDDAPVAGERLTRRSRR